MIAGFSIIFAFFISGVSLFHTTSVQKIDEGQGVSSTIYNIKERLESVIYYNDNFNFYFVSDSEEERLY